MKKIYVIRRCDWFKSDNGLPSGAVPLSAGSVWIEIGLTDGEKANYKYPIVCLND